MLFNSLTFCLFLPLVFALYWFACGRSLRTQNLLVVLASYVFYGWWDWRFLALIAFTSSWSYAAGMIEARRLEKGRDSSRLLVAVSLVVNFGILAYFKYANFFIDSAEGVLHALGFAADFPTLHIILPVGISFYTFQALSYTIDVYYRRIAPTRDVVAFFAFISFFPQLVAGPIERATNLLPQFQKTRTFDCDEALHGLCLMCYGLFKKMVVADTLALYVDKVFAMPDLYTSTTCLIGAFFFTLQIYCDFSGYSDCARGVARLFGFRLMVNFDRPYLATSFAEFWRRWHISLSTWFKDYVYIPLGGNRVSFGKILRNTWIVFLLSGLWHGASWTFVGWGGLHALFLTGGLLKRRFLPAAGNPSRFGNFLRGLFVFVGVSFAWIFFRARTFGDLGVYLRRLFSCQFPSSQMQLCAALGPMTFVFCWIAVGLLALSYLAPRDCAFKTPWGKVLYALLCLAAIVFLACPSGGEFIYFQF